MSHKGPGVAKIIISYKKNDKTAISEEELTLIFKSTYNNYQQYENVLLTDYKLTLKNNFSNIIAPPCFEISYC